jgi:hypothetical protein
MDGKEGPPIVLGTHCKTNFAMRPIFSAEIVNNSKTTAKIDQGLALL